MTARGKKLDHADEEDDFLDGCELDFSEAAVEEEVVKFLPLFPDMKENKKKAEEWNKLFEGDGNAS